MPFLFKYAIDALTADPTGHMLADMPMVQLLPATVLLGYGAARAASSLCNELRNAVFAKVAVPGTITFSYTIKACVITRMIRGRVTNNGPSWVAPV